MVWLTSQSIGPLVVGCLVIAALVAVTARFAIRALVPVDERSSVAAIAGPLMPALGAAFAILAALTLANQASALASAQVIVSHEAADASRLAWAATTPGVVGTVAIHAALQDYLGAVRDDEWRDRDALDGNDPATSAALAQLERTVRAEALRPEIGTPTSTELLAALDALTTERRARLAAGGRQLPGLYVITLAIAGVALIANASALTIGVRRRSAFLVVGLAAVIGLSMALLFAIGAPLNGAIHVGGSPIDAVRQQLLDGFFHP
jgi:hypothetical protein